MTDVRRRVAAPFCPLFSDICHPSCSLRDMAVLGEDPSDAFRAEAGTDAIDELIEVGFAGRISGEVDLARIGGRGGKDTKAHHVEAEAGVDLLGETSEFLAE